MGVGRMPGNVPSERLLSVIISVYKWRHTSMLTWPFSWCKGDDRFYIG